MDMFWQLLELTEYKKEFELWMFANFYSSQRHLLPQNKKNISEYKDYDKYSKGS